MGKIRHWLRWPWIFRIPGLGRISIAPKGWSGWMDDRDSWSRWS